MKEADKVKPSEFYIQLGGKKRRVKFGNLSLLRIEERYGSVEAFSMVQEDLTKKPMQTVPWLLSICLTDKEGLGDNIEDILKALDEEGLSVISVANTVMSAINSSLNVYAEEKKRMEAELKK